MLTIIFSLFSSARQAFHTRTALQAESQPLILHRSSRGHRLSLSRADRFLRGWLAGFWSGWRSALVIVKPDTVLASQGIPTVLEVEESPSERTTLRVTGSHRSHSSDELGESWRRNPLYGAATKILAPVSNNMAQTKVDLNFFAALSQQLFTTQTKLLEETSVLNSPRQLSSSKLADTLANPFPIKPVSGELLFRPYFLRISPPAMTSWHCTRSSATIALRVNC